MNEAPKDFLSPALKALSKPESRVKPSVDLVGPPFSVGTWGDRDLRSSVWEGKPPQEWNQKDKLSYFSHVYRIRYGNPYIWRVKFNVRYAALRDIEQALDHQLKVEGVFPVIVYKDYVDFFYVHYADGVIHGGRELSLLDLKKQKYIGPFVEQYRFVPYVPQPSEQVEAPQAAVFDLKTEMDTAQGIHAQYFLTNFGAILVANYQIAVRGKSVTDAILYVEKAYEKLRPADRKNADMATQTYAPYPKWLSVTTFRDLAIEVCDDKPEYEFLKEQKRI